MWWNRRDRKLKTTIFLAGGLGNNLFQVALGVYLEQKEVSVSYNAFLVRKNWLTSFLGWSIHDSSTIEKILGDKIEPDGLTIKHFFLLIPSFLRSKLRGGDLVSYDGKVKPVMFGYWQSGSHLNEDVYNALKALIQDLVISDHSQVRNACVVHYRGGDFPPAWRLPGEYYKEAIQLVYKNDILKKGEVEFYALTNDLEYLKHIAPQESFRVSDSRSAEDDFVRIWNSNIAILSNSTFAYWAATLGGSQVVIIPSDLCVGRKFNFPFFNKNEIYYVECSYE